MTFLLLLALQDDPVAAVRKALEQTESQSYYYKVAGRFDRTGEFVPPGVLTARIGALESAHHGRAFALKGTDGQWKTAAERGNEQTDKADAETSDRLKTLEEAQAPHVMTRELLDLIEKGRKGEDIEIDKTPCAVYTLQFSKERLKTYLEKQIETCVARGTLRKPDVIKWSTMDSSLKVYVDKKDGFLAQVVDMRTVKLEYKQSAVGDAKSFDCRFVFEFSGWGKVTASIPADVKEKLGIAPDKK